MIIVPTRYFRVDNYADAVPPELAVPVPELDPELDPEPDPEVLAARESVR